MESITLDEDSAASTVQHEQKDATSQSKKRKRETDVQSCSSSNEVSLVGGKASEKLDYSGSTMDLQFSSRQQRRQQRKWSLCLIWKLGVVLLTYPLFTPSTYGTTSAFVSSRPSLLSLLRQISSSSSKRTVFTTSLALSKPLQATSHSLDTFTVKELREKVRNSTNLKRGVISKLKNKQDLIDYLRENVKQPVGSSENGKASEKPKEDALASVKSKLENTKVDSDIVTGGKASEEQQPVGASEHGKASEDPKKSALAFIKRKLEKAKVGSDIITKMCDALAKVEAVDAMLQSCSSEAFLRLGGVSEKQISQLSKISWLNEFYQRQSAEYFLQGKIVSLLGPEVEVNKANERYNHDAVSVDRPGGSWPRERTNDIRLIYGPSGSGKTFYALKGLSQVRREDSIWKPLVLYANLSGMRKTLGGDATAATASANPEVNVDENAAATLTSKVRPVDVAKNWLEGLMTSCITKLLKKNNLIYDLEKKLDMTISVVFDEATNADFLINDISNLKTLLSVIDEFCTLPRLIITGVGIEECTKHLSTGVDVGKWRMRHWGKKNFDVCVNSDISLNEHAKEIGEMIEMYPFLEQLMTNARSAYFLAYTLKFFAANRVQRPPEFVAVVAQHVATKYIENNGLNNISSNKRRMKVVRAVLRLLWASSASRNVPIWPYGMLKKQVDNNERFVFEEFTDDDVVLIFSLLDINVEYQCGELTQVNEKRYPIEISPALTIVLYQLLGVLGTKIASRWSDFEVLAALNELSLMVIFSESVEKPFQLRFLSKPVPAPQSKVNFDIPRVGGQCVYVNGDKAPYADVLAPGRFIQCKYTATPSKGCSLDISDKLEKMGLLQNDKSIKKAYTMALCAQWDKNTGGENMDEVTKGGDVSKVVSERTFRQAYPVCVLLQHKEGYFSDYVRYQLKEENILQAENSEGEKICFEADGKFEHKIEAVFYTNAAFFMLVEGNKDGKEDGKHTIMTTDVNREGVLRSDHSFLEKQNKLVDPEVALRFIFVCDEEMAPKEKVG